MINNITLVLEDVQVSSNSVSKFVIDNRMTQTLSLQTKVVSIQSQYNLPYLDKLLQVRSEGK